MSSRGWIRRRTRIALYLRDGWCCVYCGASAVVDYPDRREWTGLVLTLDHIHPRALGGSNRPSNLVTCCRSCNGRKRAQPLHRFVAGLEDIEATRRRIRNARRRSVARWRFQAAEYDRQAQNPDHWLARMRAGSDLGARPERSQPAAEPFHLPEPIRARS